MNYDQLASFEPALAEFLEKVRHCFKRDKTFGYLQKYMAGLMADLKRKSIEPIALACGVAVRTLQEFLAFFAWDHTRVDRFLFAWSLTANTANAHWRSDASHAK